MKKVATIITFISLLLFAIAFVILKVIDNSSFGILYIGKSAKYWGIAVLLTGIICFTKGDWVKTHFQPKTAVLSLLLSASFAVSLNCIFSTLLLSILENDIYTYPIAIPANTIVALLAIAVFVGLLFLYISISKKFADKHNMSIDFLLAFLYLFPFFCLAGTLIELAGDILKPLLNL